MLRAGDLAPEVTFAKIMQSPGDRAWRHENLLGQLTVIDFFANVFDATDAFASRWNDLVAQFAGKAVQFVLIARDGDSRLEAWLREHPLEGWVLADPNWDTARNWEIPMPQAVFVDSDARILGFSQLPVPLLHASDIEQILSGHADAARLRAKPRSPGGDKPEIPASYIVHISPARNREDGTSSSGGPDHWTALGFELRAVIAKAYEFDESRIDLPASLDNGERYDFELLLPQEETWETIASLVRDAIQKHFRLVIARETRHLDVYVLTAPQGAGPDLRDAGPVGGGFLGTSSVWRSSDGTPPTPEDMRKIPIRHLSGSGMDIAELCSALERHLDRLVVDETGLEGSFDFRVSSNGDTKEDFFRALHENLGLVATPGQRDVAMLVARHQA